MFAPHDDDYADIASEVPSACTHCGGPAVSVEGLDAVCEWCATDIPADVRALRSVAGPVLRQEAATFAVDGGIERLRQMAAEARQEVA